MMAALSGPGKQYSKIAPHGCAPRIPNVLDCASVTWQALLLGLATIWPTFFPNKFPALPQKLEALGGGMNVKVGQVKRSVPTAEIFTGFPAGTVNWPLRSIVDGEGEVAVKVGKQVAEHVNANGTSCEKGGALPAPGITAAAIAEFPPCTPVCDKENCENMAQFGPGINPPPKGGSPGNRTSSWVPRTIDHAPGTSEFVNKPARVESPPGTLAALAGSVKAVQSWFSNSMCFAILPSGFRTSMIQ